MSWLRHVDDIGVWFAAVVAGLTALGWVGKRIRRAYLAARPWIDRAKAVVELAEYELQHNGGGSIKDGVAMIGPLRKEVTAIQRAAKDLGDTFAIHLVQAAAQAAARDSRLTEIEAAVTYLAEGSTAVENLAEALPVVARSTPAPDDAA